MLIIHEIVRRAHKFGDSPTNDNDYRTSIAMVRRAYRLSGGFKLAYTEDQEIWHRLRKYIYRCATVGSVGIQVKFDIDRATKSAYIQFVEKDGDVNRGYNGKLFHMLSQNDMFSCKEGRECTLRKWVDNRFFGTHLNFYSIKFVEDEKRFKIIFIDDSALNEVISYDFYAISAK